MTDEVPSMQDQEFPTAIPWYQSKIMRGIIAGVIAQIIARAQAKFNFDISAFGITVSELIDFVMDTITAGAIAYTAHARLKQETAPLVVLTKNKADVINAQTPPSATDGQQSKS